MAQTEPGGIAEATRAVQVKIYTVQNVVTGYVHIPASGYRGRVSDLLNQEGFDFLPVTEAQLFSHDGTVALAREECVIINKRIIHSVIPYGEDYGEPPTGAGGQGRIGEGLPPV